MPEMLFEVWSSAEFNSQQCGVASEASDRSRIRITPDALLVHSFRASSYRDGMQRFHDWNGWEPYTPVESVPDHIFTEEEVEVQETFLRSRVIR